MKVGIVTIFDAHPNHGNKLQNYATVKVMERLGAKTVTLVTEEQPKIWKLYVKRAMNALFGYHLSPYQGTWIRCINFHSFDKKYLHPSMRLLKGKNIKGTEDFFVIGSDQVWNPKWFTGLKRTAFFLGFADKKQKVCMAPSFGVNHIPKEEEAFFREGLKDFPYLSVREEEGAKLIAKLTGRTASVVVDPTLMLRDFEWRALEKSSVLAGKRPYILKYFIGEEGAEDKERIERLAASKGMEVYDMQDDAGKKLFRLGPCDFLYLIDHAALVATDSFHATVFSIIFGKPFLLFKRRSGDGSDMEGRTRTLLHMLELDARLPGQVDDCDAFDCYYKEAHKIIETKRMEGYQFLKKSMNI